MIGLLTLATLLLFSINVGIAVKYPGPLTVGCAVFTGGCFIFNLILMLKGY